MDKPKNGVYCPMCFPGEGEGSFEDLCPGCEESLYQSMLRDRVLEMQIRKVVEDK